MTDDTAIRIWKNEFQRPPETLERFESGNCNYVYLVQYEGKKYTLRIADKENLAMLSGSLYWSLKLGERGLPVPRVLQSNLENDPPYAVLSYLEGIVDLDWLCFGDRLYTIALTRMSLINSEDSLSYVDYWIEEENLSGLQLRVLDLYTLVFCVDFMSEKGMFFNKENKPDVSKQEIEKLKFHFEVLYKKFQSGTSTSGNS